MDIVDIVETIVLGLTVALLVFLAGLTWRGARTQLRYGRARGFWKPFVTGDLQLVVGRFTEEFALFEPSGLLGVGDAIAMTELRAFLARIGLPDFAVSYADLLNGDSLKTNLILLGGPDVNEVTKRAIAMIDSTFRFGDPSKHEVSFYDSKTGKTHPDSRDFDLDCGVILKTDNPFAKDKQVLVIAGSFGYGTWAGVRYTMSEDFLEDSIVKAGHSIEALIETDVLFGTPQDIRLVALRELKGH